MGLKKCKRCGEVKSLDEYYRHKEMADGHLSYCKQCTRERTTKHRWDNIEKTREYDRFRRRKENLTEEQIAKENERCRKKRANLTQKQKNRRNEYNEKYRSVYGRGKTYHMVSRKLKAPNKCVLCGRKTKLHGHHEDYSKPLDVIWCCPGCHSRIHRGE